MVRIVFARACSVVARRLWLFFRDGEMIGARGFKLSKKLKSLV